MKRLFCVSVVAMFIPAVAGCGCLGQQQQTPQVVYKPVYVPTPAPCQPAACCPPVAPAPTAVETLSPW